jgi:hypothetical protein
MINRFAFVAMTAAALLLSPCNPASGEGQQVLVIEKVATDIGATPQQVRESIGCVLIEAERRLDTTHYLQIANLIPEADEYRKLATNACVFKGSISSGNELNVALGDLGLTPEQSRKLVTELAEYLSAAGDPSVGKLLLRTEE